MPMMFGMLAASAIGLAAVTSTPPSSPNGDAPSLNCFVGPLQRTYGGTKWSVYSCADGQTLAILAIKGNPAFPFAFFLIPSPGGTRIVGEGTGDKASSDAAVLALESLTPIDIATLVRETYRTKIGPASPAAGN